MNNFKPFVNSYLEVTLPISSEMLEVIENSEYSYALDDYHREKIKSVQSEGAVQLLEARLPLKE